MASAAVGLTDDQMSALVTRGQSSMGLTDDEMIRLLSEQGHAQAYSDQSAQIAPSDQIPEISEANENYTKIGPTPLNAFQGAPRPPERLYRENAPQLLQDVWNLSEGGAPEVGPLREQQVRPDVREVPTLASLSKWFVSGRYKPELALPNEPTGVIENTEAGLRLGVASTAADILSLGYALAKGELPDEREGYTPIRQEAYQKIYDFLTRVSNVKDIASPEDFSGALARGLGQAGAPLVETLLLSGLTGGVVNPAWAGLSETYPTMVAKVAPIVNNALTLGVQGAIEPERPGAQAAAGATTGTVLGAVSPYGRVASAVIGAGLGGLEEYSTNPNATLRDVARSMTLMGAFGGLSAARGLPLEDTVAGTLWDWAKEKYRSEELARIQIGGASPVVNEFAEEMATRISSEGLDLSASSEDVSKTGLIFNLLEAEARVAALETRAKEFHSALTPIAQEMRTTAALDTDAGRIIAGGRRDLAPLQRAMRDEGEFTAKLRGAHAEITALEYAAKNGMRPRALAVTRKICPDCAAEIERSGGTLTSPTTAIWPKE